MSELNYTKSELKGATAIFSIEPIEGKRKVASDDGIDVVSPDEIAVEGRCVVKHIGDHFFGNGKPFTSPVLVSPTYGQLNDVATQMMRETGDIHHRYFESANIVGVENGVNVVELGMGS